VSKTLLLYLIMITGCIWEKVVFGRYLFAKAFFWEDVFSMLVLALHTAYLLALTNAWLATHALMVLALGAFIVWFTWPKPRKAPPATAAKPADDRTEPPADGPR
jgi:3-vinyl bacteriochlorophyllide hydratase